MREKSHDVCKDAVFLMRLLIFFLRAFASAEEGVGAAGEGSGMGFDFDDDDDFACDKRSECDECDERSESRGGSR